ncbi:phosphonoacetaldehyde hydrolase [Cytobacillus solani]|uniref:phosphonoacetaldehyde hydrolase n=1 Tax=Cytobacillus solani TaxID=1637975 RepID=UPI0006ABB570|nr:phosphonoacetaldehyde hydrolase [Cytobacillus solani]KOP71674.1 phosphonoacetaldehyde hydrolase [Bacillus sp. FJAT-21945]USK54966.1 phosphonoacetaldehyde hydrolase [Cytobacillus solani]
MHKVEGVILDWAGTTVDFGCFAPVNVFIDIFKHAGIDVTMEEARAPMGMLKIDHIREMLMMPRVSGLWEAKFGRRFNEQDVEDLYAEFEPALMSSLKEYTDPIPRVVETVQKLKEMGLKVGSTTGYTQSMMDVVVPHAASKSYSPDFYITPDGTNSLGRPYPYMIYRNMEALKLSAVWKVIKVGDTVSDIKEGVNAGVWSVGVIIGSSELGLSLDEFNALSKIDQETAIAKTEQTFIQNGADFTMKSISELPQLVERINHLIAEGKRPYTRVEKIE